MIRRGTVGTTTVLGFGASNIRTSWVIYNTSAGTIYWNNSRDGASTGAGFPIPSGGTFAAKIPEDDPTLEVWIVGSGAGLTFAIYEGFGSVK